MTSKGKAGSNWKKLKKVRNAPLFLTICRHSVKFQTIGSDPHTTKRRKFSHSSHENPSFPSSLPKGKARADVLLDEEKQHASGRSASSSPAPTSLPWFAEDLSPEDLALVRTNSGSKPTGVGSSSSATLDASSDNQEKKKQAILGGQQSLSGDKAEPGTYVAIDCEMVGVGPNASESVLARVSIVNWHGAKLLDTFVRPQEKVTDYRTWVSGVRPQDLKNAPTFQTVQQQVADLIKGRVLIGHAIHNDLSALLLSHPRPLLRDTSTFQPCRDLAKTKHPSLRKLVSLKLGIDIQQRGEEHSSLEDARATMALYRSFHAEWQKSLTASLKTKTKSKGKPAQIIGPGGNSKRSLQRKESSQKLPPNQTQPRKSTDDTDWWKSV